MLRKLRNFRPGTGFKLKASSHHQVTGWIKSALQNLPSTAVVNGFVKVKLIERSLTTVRTDNVLPEPQWEEIVRLERELNVEHDALASHPPAKNIEVISASVAAANTPVDPESDIPSSKEN
ncbi:unnamed protein product [Phytophthora fragariaefolia]|uniref:Unnamed protein product n=1 Tax=Phytophthora fragariaefolia TaxID=1490495 RepID=A0A9W6XY65_9STRA|nr:unnamed protein product [Phytophthora fragariaefolia]